MHEQNIRVDDLIDALKRKKMFIVIITLLSAISASLLCFYVIKPQYEASTKLFIGKELSSEQIYDSNDVQMYQKLLQTYTNVIMTKDLVEDALNECNSSMNIEDALKNLTVTPKTDTQILSISFRDTDAKEAVEIVEAVTDIFIERSTELISNANVQVIEKVRYPEKPVAPNKKLIIGTAAMLGLFISLSIALTVELMNNTFRDREQIENMLGVSVIGVVPDLTNEK